MSGLVKLFGERPPRGQKLITIAAETLPLHDGRRVLRLVVKDNGPGISGGVLSRRFESFVTKPRGKGSGLGLPLCKRIIEGMGGDDHRRK